MEKKRTYGVWAVRSSTSIFGPAQSWCKENGKPLEFDTKAAAENYVSKFSPCTEISSIITPLLDSNLEIILTLSKHSYIRIELSG